MLQTLYSFLTRYFALTVLLPTHAKIKLALVQYQGTLTYRRGHLWETTTFALRSSSKSLCLRGGQGTAVPVTSRSAFAKGNFLQPLTQLVCISHVPQYILEPARRLGSLSPGSFRTTSCESSDKARCLQPLNSSRDKIILSLFFFFLPSAWPLGKRPYKL